MPANKSKEAIYSQIWKIAEDLRGDMDGWKFRNCILVLVFYRYISEKLANYINNCEWDAGNRDFDYAELDDFIAEDFRMLITPKFEYFILPSELFDNLRVGDEIKSVYWKVRDTLEFPEIYEGIGGRTNLDGLFSSFEFSYLDRYYKNGESSHLLKKWMDGIAAMPLVLEDKGEAKITFIEAFDYLLQRYDSCTQQVEKKEYCFSFTRDDIGRKNRLIRRLSRLIHENKESKF